MAWFFCPKCKTKRHVDDEGPRKDCCWFCGTPVPIGVDEVDALRSNEPVKSIGGSGWGV